MGTYFSLAANKQVEAPRAVSLEVEVFLSKELKEASYQSVREMLESMESMLSSVLKGLVVSAKVARSDSKDKHALIVLDKLTNQNLDTTKRLIEQAKTVLVAFFNTNIDFVEVRFGSVSEKYNTAIDLSEIV